MPAKSYKENLRVVIEPRRLGNLGSVRMSDSILEPNEERRSKYYEDTCKEICAQVKRHIDDIESVSVDFDVVEQCEFCGSRWTEVNKDYNGGCCSKDEELQLAREANDIRKE